jgi:hypothetical protein
MQGMVRKPTILGRIVGMLFLLVIGVPVLLLLLSLAVVSAVIFLILGLWAALMGRVRFQKPVYPRPKPGHDDAGRKNVRVRE